MDESLSFHLLNRLPGCGAKTMRFLVSHFGSATAAWQASDTDWSLFHQPRLSAMATARSSIDPTTEAGRLAHDHISVIPFTHPLFPTLLSEIPDAPALLYVRGPYHSWNTDPLIAIVGSRKFTAYGKQVAQELASTLGRAGYIIVSGLAFGIDSIAHQAVLETDAATLAVLGSGIDDRAISPQSHLPLAHDILDHGALLSELAPGVNATVGTFPARNRIMAGMCHGIIVIEAAEASGSLITARLALDYNRDVFAVPGSIFAPTSVGTHALIKSGARLVTGVNDIIEELGGRGLSAQQVTTPEVILTDLDPDEVTVYQALSDEGIHIDKLIITVRLEAMRVNMALTRLELRGLIKNIGGMHYIKSRK